MFCELLVTTVICHASIADRRIEEAFSLGSTSQRQFAIYEPLYQVEQIPIPVYAVRSMVLASKNKPNHFRTVKQGIAPSKVELLAYAPGSEIIPAKKVGMLAKLFSSTPTTKAPKNLSPGYAAVYKASIKHGVDPNFMLKVAKQENGGRCKRDSSAGAKGVLQVMPGTARQHGISKASKLNDCNIGADVGVREMKKLLTMTKGDKAKALVGYNCGPACIGRKRLPKETKHYVKAILGKSI